MRRCVHTAIALTTFASISPAQQVLVEPLIRSSDLVPGTSIPLGSVLNGTSAINPDGSVTAVLQSRVLRTSTGGLQTLFNFTDPVAPLGMPVTPFNPPTLFTGQAFASTAVRPDGQVALAVGIPPTIAISRGDPSTGNWFATGIPSFYSNARNEAVYVDDEPFRVGYWNPSLGSNAQTLLSTPTRPNPNDRQRFEPPTITDLGTIFVPRVDPIEGVNSRALLAGRPGAMNVLLGGGLPVPGLPAGSRLFDFPRRNGLAYRVPIVCHAADDSAATIITCSLPTSANPQGVLFVGNAGGMTAAVVGGTHVPGLDNGLVVSWPTLGTIDPVFVSSGGFVATSCRMRDPITGTTSGSAILAGYNTSIRAILKTGDAVSGISNAIINAPVPLGSNALGDVLVHLTLSGDVTDDSNQLVAVFTQDNGLVPLVREGQTIELAPGDVRVVASGLWVGLTNPAFVNTLINDQRQIILSLRFADQSSALVRFTIPAPATAAIGVLLAPVVLVRRRRALLR